MGLSTAQLADAHDSFLTQILNLPQKLDLFQTEICLSLFFFRENNWKYNSGKIRISDKVLTCCTEKSISKTDLGAAKGLVMILDLILNKMEGLMQSINHRRKAPCPLRVHYNARIEHQY